MRCDLATRRSARRSTSAAGGCGKRRAPTSSSALRREEQARAVSGAASSGVSAIRLVIRSPERWARMRLIVCVEWTKPKMVTPSIDRGGKASKQATSGPKRLMSSQKVAKIHAKKP